MARGETGGEGERKQKEVSSYGVIMIYYESWLERRKYYAYIEGDVGLRRGRLGVVSSRRGFWDYDG